MNKLAFLPLLLIIGSMSAYAQIPESYYNQTKLYDNQQTSPKISASVDKFSYTVQDTIHVSGTVSNYKQGSKLTISLIDPQKKTINQYSILATTDGFFSFDINFPSGASSGKYSVLVYYYNTNSQSIVSFNVLGNEIPTSIAIPYGASIQFNKPSFNPVVFKVQAGLPITWINNDNAVHEISSGKMGFGGRVFPDGQFDSGIIGPGQTYTLALFTPGNYTYYDKTSSWLVGELVVVPYVGPTSQKPVEHTTTPSANLPDNYLTVATQPHALESNEKTLFNDNMTALFSTWKQSKSDNVTLSNGVDAKMGINSLKIQANVKGRASIYHDYTPNKLQDWSNYNYLNFWFKGQNTKNTFNMGLLSASWKSAGYYNLVDDSSDWKKVQIPLYSTYKNIDLSKVRGFEVVFNKGTSGQFKIDDIQLVSEGQKTLFNDDIASVFATWKQNNSSVVTISNSNNDTKVGINNLNVQVQTTDGPVSVFHDYTPNKLQDWSNYNYLNLWFKGQNTKNTLSIGIVGTSWKSGGSYNFVDDSSDWKKVQIPLYSTYKNIDLSKVRGFEVVFNKGTSGQFKIDDITLSISPADPNLQNISGDYIYDEAISILGNVQVVENNTAVAIQILNPNNNIVTINQATPKTDGTFSFSLPLSGNQFNNAGVYKISAQYGFAEHKASASFTLLVPKLVQTYENFTIYQINNSTLYAIPQHDGAFNINRIIAGQYNTILTNSTTDNIKKTIDEITAVSLATPPPPVIATPPPPVIATPPPEKSFPIPNSVLFQIWQERKDLQTAYPEVSTGNLTGLKKWAAEVGWNQEPRLSALIPQGEIPQYQVQNQTVETKPTEQNNDLLPILKVLIAVVVIAIGGVIGYKFYVSKKKAGTSVPEKI